MAQPSWAGIITAAAGVITALALLCAALPALITVLRRTAVNTAAVRANTTAVQEVHQIVNQAHTDAMRYQVALIDALNRAGIAVPADQSLNVAPPASPPPAAPK